MTPLETLELKLSQTKTRQQIKAIKSKNRGGPAYSLAGVPTYIKQLALKYRNRGMTVQKAVVEALKEAREEAAKGNTAAAEALTMYRQKRYANINRTAKAEFKGQSSLATYRRSLMSPKKRNEKK